MPDHKNSGSNKNTGNKPKDLPAKPTDKKTDDKVKGGMSSIKFNT